MKQKCITILHFQQNNYDTEEIFKLGSNSYITPD